MKARLENAARGRWYESAQDQEKKLMEISAQTTSNNPKVAIIGGGFGGLYAARILANQAVDVTGRHGLQVLAAYDSHAPRQSISETMPR
jgi:hypothetical protein